MFIMKIFMLVVTGIAVGAAFKFVTDCREFVKHYF